MRTDLTGTMYIVCMDCKKSLGTKSCSQDQNGTTTSSRCDNCHAVEMAKLARIKKEREGKK